MDFEGGKHYFSEKNFLIFRMFFLFRIEIFRKKRKTVERGDAFRRNSRPFAARRAMIFFRFFQKSFFPPCPLARRKDRSGKKRGVRHLKKRERIVARKKRSERDCN